MRLIGGALAALLALWLHTLTERVWPGGARFALLFPTILLSCLVLGRVGGLSALATGLVGVWMLMMPSRGDLAHVSSGDLSALCLYAASGLLVVVVTRPKERSAGSCWPNVMGPPAARPRRTLGSSSYSAMRRAWWRSIEVMTSWWRSPAPSLSNSGAAARYRTAPIVRSRLKQRQHFSR